MANLNITKANEDYLEAIYMLELSGVAIKSVSISTMLGVSKPAVNKAMNELKEMGLIEKDNYTKILLTDAGRLIGEKTYQKHIMIKDFLRAIGVSEKNANLDCCKLEHILSEETLTKMKEFSESYFKQNDSNLLDND